MIVLGRPGEQRITIGQYIAAYVGSAIMVFGFYFWFPFIANGPGIPDFIKEKNIHTLLGYFKYMIFDNGFLFSFNFFMFTFFTIILAILLLRVYATPGEDDRVIL